MPLFQYRAYGANEKLQKGTHDAANENEVKQYLQANHLYPVEIKPTRFSKNQQKASNAGAKQAFRWGQWWPYQKNYHREIAVFTRQLQTLLAATLPYDKALALIIAQTADPAFQNILSDVRSRVVEGAHLAEAMAQHPKVFSRMYVGMVRSGESGGQLGVIMQRLANFYERQEALRSKIKSALIYPTFMVLFSMAVIAFILLVIVPKITAVFETRDALLPLPTRLLIGVSDFFAHYWLQTFVGLGLLLLWVAYFLKTPTGLRFADKAKLSLPLVKILVRKALVLRFCQTLGTLLKSGVDLKAALEISKQVVANHFFLEKLDQVIGDVNNRGLPLSEALRRVGVFPEYVCHVVAIGEQASQVEDLLEKVAEQMELEMANTLEGLTSLLQPVMILLMGGVIGFIAVAILLPMLNMNQLL